MAAFRKWDRATAQRVTHFVANSRAVARRIERFYGRFAQVIHPPVRTDFFTPQGEREDYFLYVGRMVSYKRPELVTEAFAELPYRLIAVGDGHLRVQLERRAPSNIVFLGEVPDERLRDLYRGARALVFPGNEDFGIVMAESQACGTPVIGTAEGGALDIVAEGVTGWLVERPSVAALRGAIHRAACEQLDPSEIRRSAEKFGRERFKRELRRAVEEMVVASKNRKRSLVETKSRPGDSEDRLAARSATQLLAEEA